MLHFPPCYRGLINSNCEEVLGCNSIELLGGSNVTNIRLVRLLLLLCFGSFNFLVFVHYQYLKIEFVAF